MKEIKINFTDFWANFDKKDNFFYNLLSQNYNVIIDNNPDFIIYSTFGSNYLNYQCKRVFYTGENVRPDFTACDFAFSYDFNSKENHYRLPIYILYLGNPRLLNAINKKYNLIELKNIWDAKEKFCCMVVSNPNSKKRINFFKKLSKIKKVDSGGAVLNNIGGRVKNKLDFISEYKFVISFENTSNKGYTTEKLLEAIAMNCIPIFWGHKSVEKDFNPNRFINYDSFKSEDDLIEKIIEIEKDSERAIEILRQPVFSNDRFSFHEEQLRILNCFDQIINSKRKPIAKTYWIWIHLIKRFSKKRFNISYKYTKYLKLDNYVRFILKNYNKL